ncbi:hypothetical protein [Nocardia sp. NPDC050710]|uniref:hypothetical protein n=1 Tax=Nocardia sp. NPDC050710 TaxID=3157220 RepID=UPI0033E3E228
MQLLQPFEQRAVCTLGRDRNIHDTNSQHTHLPGLARDIAAAALLRCATKEARETGRDEKVTFSGLIQRSEQHPRR